MTEVREWPDSFASRLKDGEVTTLALTVNVEEGCELDEAPTTPAESGSMAPGGEAVLEHGSEEVVPSSQMSTVPVEGLVGPTAEDAGDTGCVPEEMTIAQYQAVYQQWVVGELTDNEVQMQHGLGVLELLQNQYAVLQGAEEDTAQLLAGGVGNAWRQKMISTLSRWGVGRSSSEG